MRPYPVSLRRAAVRAVQEGTPLAVVARTWQIGQSTLKRYLRQERTTGDLTPRRPPGRTPLIRPTDYPVLAAQLAAFPAATLAEHAAYWERASHPRVSPWTIGRAIARLGYVRVRRP